MWSGGALARATVARAHRRVVRGGSSISDSSPPEDLHLLRKRVKELRYALEMFAPVLDDAPVGGRRRQRGSAPRNSAGRRHGVPDLAPAPRAGRRRARGRPDRAFTPIPATSSDRCPARCASSSPCCSGPAPCPVGRVRIGGRRAPRPGWRSRPDLGRVAGAGVDPRCARAQRSSAPERATHSSADLGVESTHPEQAMPIRGSRSRLGGTADRRLCEHRSAAMGRAVLRPRHRTAS